MRKIRVLIVEDETIIALDVKGILKELGYEVADIAATGEAAVEKAASLKPDIILMDILLAGSMDGIEAARAIRRANDIPIIYITANADKATVDRASDTQPYAYLNKPIHERDLYSNIESARVKHRTVIKLRESERRFRDALANARLIAVQLDANGTILFCNDFLLNLTGYTQDELIGGNWFGIFEQGKSADENRRAHQKMLELDKVPLHYEGTLLTKSGESRLVRWNNTALYAMNGSPYATSSIGEDITESKKAEEALLRANQELTAANEELQAAMEELEAANEEFEVVNEELHKTLETLSRSENDYRMLFESMLNGFALHEIICDEKGVPVDYRFLRVNPAFERLTGLRAADITGKSVLEVLPGTEREWIDRYGAVALTMEPVSFENYHGGVRRHFEVTAFSPEKGQFAVLFNDVTERKLFESKLRESEKKFRLLFETMAQGVIYHDASGAIIDANPAAARLLGLSMDQLMSFTSIDLRRRAIREDGTGLRGEEYPDREAMRTGEPVENFIMGFHHSIEETHRWISVNAVPQFTEGEHRPYRVFATFTDITDIRRAQDELKDNQRLLERALRVAGLGYWELDLTQGSATVSPASRRIYGFGDGKLTIADIQILPLPEYRAMLDDALAGLVNRNEKYDVTFKIRRATDGAILTIHSLAEYNRATNRVFGVISEIPDPPATGETGQDSGKKDAGKKAPGRKK
ncbi:MAG TPA: PAS domain S-box protein [Spirochaetota bacterium]|nr:PAS domain S-box protein [Spirochaetota bacterium]